MQTKQIKSRAPGKASSLYEAYLRIKEARAKDERLHEVGRTFKRLEREAAQKQAEAEEAGVTGKLL